jgi:predicted nuclease of predicted toxin-antitoxin system
MKILVDENVPMMTVQSLREMGHDVLDFRDTADEGKADEALWGICQHQGRLLVTTDKGFTQNRDEQHHGILIVRLRQPNRHKIHKRVMRAITQFSEKEWPGLLVVVRDMVQSVWRARG